MSWKHGHESGAPGSLKARSRNRRHALCVAIEIGNDPLRIAIQNGAATVINKGKNTNLLRRVRGRLLGNSRSVTFSVGSDGKLFIIDRENPVNNLVCARSRFGHFFEIL